MKLKIVLINNMLKSFSIFSIALLFACSIFFAGCNILKTQPVIEPCLDSDNDGVCEDEGQCPDTIEGVRVDSVGCQIRSDPYVIFEKDKLKADSNLSTDLQINNVEKKPIIHSISPQNCFSGGSDFKLRIIGKNFKKTSKINLNNIEINTLFENNTILFGRIDKLHTYKPGVVEIKIVTPQIGESNSMLFTIFKNTEAIVKEKISEVIVEDLQAKMKDIPISERFEKSERIISIENEVLMKYRKLSEMYAKLAKLKTKNDENLHMASSSITFPKLEKFNAQNSNIPLSLTITSIHPITYAEVQDVNGIEIAELKSKGENNYSCQFKKLKQGINKFRLHAIDETGYEKTSSVFIVKKIPSTISLKGWYKSLNALVVGINNYENQDIPRLHKAESDTRKIAEILQNMGFNVQALYGSNATRTNIISRMRAIKNQQNPGDGFIFFFSGHGHVIHTREKKRIGYIVPYDSAVDLKGTGVMIYNEQCISIPYIQDIASDMPAKHTAFFLDSCFSGRLVLASKGSIEISRKRDTEFYETLLNQRAINLLTSGADKTVYEGNGEYSPFVQALMNGFEKGSLDIGDQDGLATFGELAAFVQTEVMRLTKGEQQPQSANFASENGQLIFKIRQ